MDGHLTDDALLTFTLGASGDDERLAIDAHLCACPACLRAFLDLKRHVEQGAPPERPSAATRARLREDVARAFQLSRRDRLARALRRPIPLYQGLAAAAVAVALVALGPAAAHLSSRARGGPRGERVDTARTSPESLTIY